MALGRAFIEIFADTKPFNKELGQMLAAALAAAEATARKSSRRVGEKIADEVGEGIKSKAAGLGKRIKEGVEKSRPIVDVDVDVDRRGRFTAFLRSIGRRLVDGIQDAAKFLPEAFSKILGPFSDFVANVFNVPAGSPLAAILTALAVTILPALIPAIIALSAAIADLLGLLALIPGGLAVILGIIAPLIIAFHNLSDAFDLVFEKDPEKLKEGLKELSPTLQGLVQILREFAPTFKAIGEVVQAAVIGPINQILKPVLQGLLPILKTGFVTVGVAIGNLLAQIATFLNSPVFKDFLTKLFPAISRIVETLGPPIIHILSALTSLAEHTMPFLERFIGGFGTFIEKFADFLDRTIASGEMDQFLTDAFDSLEAIGDLTISIIGFVHSLLATTNDEGRSLLDVLTQMFNDFSEFFNSPEGRDLLNELAELAVIFADNLKVIIPILSGMLLPLFAIADVINRIIFGLRKMIDLIRQAKGDSGRLGEGLGGIVAGIGVPHFDQGGIARKDTLARIAESGPEAIIPLNNPRRAAEVMAQAGLVTAPSVTVYLGTEQITDILDTRVDRGLRDIARSVDRGPRGD